MCLPMKQWLTVYCSFIVTQYLILSFIYDSLIHIHVTTDFTSKERI